MYRVAGSSDQGDKGVSGVGDLLSWRAARSVAGRPPNVPDCAANQPKENEVNQNTQADSSAPIGCSAADGPQLPHNAARSAAAYASLGDVICCTLQTMPQILEVKLLTPEAVDYGTYLIDTGRWTLQPVVPDDH